MPPSSDRLGEYLDLEEPLTAVCTATLSENSSWKPVTVGVTDRRLICLAEDGTAVNVGHDAIGEVSSRPKTTLVHRGTDAGLLLGLGALLAVAGPLVAGYVVGSAAVAMLLALGGGGAAAAAYVRRRGPDAVASRARTRLADANLLDDVAPPAAGDRLPDGEWADRASAYADRASGYADRLSDYAERVDAATDDGRVAVGAGLLVAAVGVLAAVAVAPVVPVVAGGAAALVGVALAALAGRDRSGGLHLVREREREVTVRTDAGRTLHIRCDPSAELDRELGRQAFAGDARAAHVVSPSP